MILLYLALLLGGVIAFVLSYVAQFRLASLMRQRHPQQWRIIAEPESGKPSGFRTWVRMQHAMRSPAIALLDDASINHWLRVWRISPWFGWVCWLAALAMRLLLH